LAGRNFGDEGLFFLAESLAFNQVTTILHLSLLSYFLVYLLVIDKLPVLILLLKVLV